jgi:hypothetical protein
VSLWERREYFSEAVENEIELRKTHRKKLEEKEKESGR